MATYIFVTVIILLFLGVMFCLYMLERNDKVYKYRIKAVNNSLEEYHKLPTYKFMMKKFWVWPLDKFKQK